MDVSLNMTAKKYFIAIVIPEPFFSEIESIKSGLLNDHNLKGALRSPSHITLHRPFEWREDKEELLIEKLKTFRFEQSFRIELCNYAAFVPRVIYVNVVENSILYSLHEQLKNFAKKGLRLFNEDEDKRGFHPHVTVAFRDLKKARFDAVWKEFENKTFSGAFEWQGFSLLKLEKRWEEAANFTVR